MANILQQVQTFQLSSLAVLQNANVFIDISNKKYLNFDRLVANRGDSVGFSLPSRFVTNDGLAVTFQDAEQRIQNLVVDNAVNVAYEFTDQEILFNVHDYIERFGEPAMAEIGARVEASVAQNCLRPYRFYGDAITPLESQEELASALTRLRSFGSARTGCKGIIPMTSVPRIVSTMANQFAPKRNDEIVNDWFIGDWGQCEWYQSNLLPVHIAGTVGQAAETLTVVSISPDGTQITCSGASTGNTVVENDLGFFTNANPAVPRVNYLTFVGHQPSDNPVQFRVTQDATATATEIVLQVEPALISTPGDRNQNITTPIVAGMEISILKSHRSGMLYGGNALYLAMPRLPNTTPFPSANSIDPNTGASIRLYYGTDYGQGITGFINNAIWGSTMVPEYGIQLIFPAS